MEQLLEQLMRSPKLDLYFRQIGDVLAKEKAARLNFYNEITEQDKAEFIFGQPVYHSPVRYEHNESRRRLCRSVSTFAELKHLGVASDEMLMISQRPANSPQRLAAPTRSTPGFSAKPFPRQRIQQHQTLPSTEVLMSRAIRRLPVFFLALTPLIAFAEPGPATAPSAISPREVVQQARINELESQCALLQDRLNQLEKQNAVLQKQLGRESLVPGFTIQPQTVTPGKDWKLSGSGNTWHYLVPVNENAGRITVGELRLNSPASITSATAGTASPAPASQKILRNP